MKGQSLTSGRRREIEKITKAKKAAAAGRLLLGEIKSWPDFLESDLTDLSSLLLSAPHITTIWQNILRLARFVLRALSAVRKQGQTQEKAGQPAWT